MAAALPLPIAWIPGVTTWVIIWSALAGASVVIVALMRTRWGEVRPWKKCALLSLWVHVLLACLAITVRIGVGGPGIGPGSGGPIRVAVVNVARTPAPSSEQPAAIITPPSEPDSRDAAAERDEPKDDPPPAEEPATEADPQSAPATPAPEPVVIEQPTPPTEVPTPDISLEAPDLLPQPAPKPKEPTPISAEAKPNRPAKDNPAPAALKNAQPEITLAGDADSHNVATARATPSIEGAVVDPDAQPRTGVPAEYANRFADRDALVAGGGGNPTTERAVRLALAWLANAQSDDGHWDPKRFGAGQETHAILGQHRGTTGARADTGISALALLAFLGAGHTHRNGPYADNVARGLDYLRGAQAANGNLGGDAEMFAHMYCHSMATFALSEACAMTGDDKLRPMVRKAVAYSLAAQHPTDGGWRYQAGQPGDTSQLGWQLMALRSAQLASVDVPLVVWTRVERFLRAVERGPDRGLAAYRPEEAWPSRTMTAEALFCRQLVTHRRDGGLAPAAIDEARRSLRQELPGRGKQPNFYYWYYGTIALHRAQHASAASADAWHEWNEALTGELVSSQAEDGSWPPACVWGGYGGRVYTTALGAMCLEVYYRYAPEDDAGIARRDEWQSVPAR